MGQVIEHGGHGGITTPRLTRSARRTGLRSPRRVSDADETVSSSVPPEVVESVARRDLYRTDEEGRVVAWRASDMGADFVRPMTDEERAAARQARDVEAAETRRRAGIEPLRPMK